MTCTEGQPFGGNWNPVYTAIGLKGHSGQDWNCGFGTPIHSPVAGVAYKVLTKENPSNDGSGFTGVFILVDDGIESYEWLIGHCNPTIQEGDEVAVGDLIGTEANHGTVFSGNTQITLAMQNAGDQRGSHRHEQKRPFMKSKVKFQPALSAQGDVAGTYRDSDGNYYLIFGYSNGYNGCVDPSAPVFTRDLWTGSQGYDVYVLQRLLASLGFLKVAPTGYFGFYTNAAVTAFQQAHNLTPQIGYFGPKTRAVALPMIPTVSSTPLG